MQERFISEAIKPCSYSYTSSRMSRGEPSLPKEFVWRDKTYRVVDILEHWKETGSCTHGSEERYLRKHWYRIRTKCGQEMKIYFDKQATPLGKIRTAWRVYSLSG